MTEFISAWLGNTFLALCLTVSTILPLTFIISIPISALWDSLKTKIPVGVRSRVVLPPIPGRYITMLPFLVAVVWGLLETSNPKKNASHEEITADDHHRRPYTPPMERCLNGQIPWEFLKADRKMLRALQFEQGEAMRDLDTIQKKWVRRSNFLVEEGELAQEAVDEHISLQLKEREQLIKYAEKSWNSACQRAAYKIDHPAHSSVALPVP